MRRFLAFGLLAYVAGSLLVYGFGDSGVTALRSLAGYRDRLEANLKDLEAVNRSLQVELESLRDDPRRTEVLARDLGLYRPGDRVVRVDGAPSAIQSYEVGTLLRRKSARDDRGPWLKTAGLGVAALVAVAAFLLGRRGRRSLHGVRRR